MMIIILFMTIFYPFIYLNNLFERKTISQPFPSNFKQKFQLFSPKYLLFISQNVRKSKKLGFYFRQSQEFI